VNRVDTLVATPTVRLERFDHPPGVPHRDPERERASGHAVNFIDAGTFRVRTDGPWRVAGADRVFVTRPGLEFSCAHDDECPCDRCLSIRYSEQAIESLRGAGAALPAGWLLPVTNRTAYLRHALLVASGTDAARVEALAGAVLWALAAPPPARQALLAPARLTWYAARVDRALARIDADFAEPLTLTALAREAGLSVYQFARVFAELQGVPPHRYLTRVRLQAARGRLREGASVTEACFATGFNSLSHFITTYRRYFGGRPSLERRRTAR
jgi:AraC-like DNA-binding protein